jgi:putative sigma-54 modulation protein
VEVIANLKGTTVICNFESPDMYESIDSAAHALYRKLVRYKERRQDGWHGGAAMGQDLQAALDDMEGDMAVSPSSVDGTDDTFVDKEAPQITKVNSFDLENKMSVQEAIFALDYIDHDFYVFRSEETDKITVVYKRHGGGIGLIEP